MNKFKKYFELEEAALLAVGLGAFESFDEIEAYIDEAKIQLLKKSRKESLLALAKSDKSHTEKQLGKLYDPAVLTDLIPSNYRVLLNKEKSENPSLGEPMFNKAIDIYEGLKDLSLDSASNYKMMLDEDGNEVIHRDGLKKFFLENGEPEIADKFKVTGVQEDKEEESLSQKDYDTLLKIAVALAASNSEICPDGKPMSIKNGIEAIKRLYDKETNGDSVHGLGTIKGGPASDIMRSLRELKNNK